MFSGPPPQVAAISFMELNNASLRINWTAPQNECLANYIIKTTANSSTSSTDTSALLTKPTDDPPDTTYTVSITAVDQAGREGEQSDILCFSFSGKCTCNLFVE